MFAVQRLLSRLNRRKIDVLERISRYTEDAAGLKGLITPLLQIHRVLELAGERGWIEREISSLEEEAGLVHPPQGAAEGRQEGPEVDLGKLLPEATAVGSAE